MSKLKIAFLFSMIMLSYCIKVKVFPYFLIPQKYTFNSVPFGDQNQKYTNTPITETSSSNNPSSNLLGTQLNYNDIRAQLSRGIISQAELENEKNLNLLVNQYQPQSNKEKSDEIELITSDKEISESSEIFNSSINKNYTTNESNSNQNLVQEDDSMKDESSNIDPLVINPINFTNNRIIPSAIEKEPIKNNITILNHTTYK